MIRKIALVALTLALLVPSRAWAHAHLKRSNPAAGARLISPPQLIRLWFTEQPELSMTFAALTDSSGKAYSLGAAARGEPGQMEIVFQVSSELPAGRYTLSWRTAASDGHPSNGKFSFVVLEQTNQALQESAPIPTPPVSGESALIAGNQQAATTSVEANDTDHASSVSNSLARAALFVALLALIGTISFHFLVLRGARHVSAESKNRMSDQAARFGAAAAVAVIMVVIIRLYLESRMMSAMPNMPGMQGMSILDMLTQTQWGIGLGIQLIAAIIAAIGFALSLKHIRAGWWIAAASAVVIAVTPALSGHAAATPKFTSLMIFGDWLHVIGAASWLGSLLCVMVIGIPIILADDTSPDPAVDSLSRWTSVASLVNAFSRLAQLSVLVLVASGVFAAWVHLEHLAALWETSYGKILLVKLVLVAITAGVGAYNFKRVQPNLSNQTGVGQLRRSASMELATALVVLVVTGFLTGVSPQ